MKNQKQTIRKIVSFLNNPEEDGGFWLPNIQRPFVWREDQICRLFDSILREYPIGTLLVWKATSSVRRRKFIDNWMETLRLSDFYVPEDSKKKCLVLDGQQRLESLFIGLQGSYDGKELYLDVLSGDIAAPDDVKYKFRFFQGPQTFPWLKFKDIVWSNKNTRQIVRDIAANAGRPLGGPEEDKLEHHIDIINKSFKMDEVITYQELDSIDNPELYSEDDVVEVFIRANSGGTRLGKSDLLFSLLSATWDVADEKVEDLLDSLNRHGFAFDRDFVLKTCLVLLDQGARYEVEKFRKPGIRDQIERDWNKIGEAVQDVLDFVRGKTYIQCDKALPTYLVLIPLIYFRYHHEHSWKRAQNMDAYVLRSALTGAFSGNPDNLLDALIHQIRDTKSFDIDDMFTVIRSQGRSLELTENQLSGMGYGSSSIHLLFNIWYREFNYVPAYENNLPQIDHIFPQRLLKVQKTANPRTGRMDLLRYRESERNQLANCMLLSRQENGAGGKWDTPPDEWFADKGSDYLAMHLIPEDPQLWTMARFEDFIEARKQLIRAKFASLLAPASRASGTGD